MKKYIFIAAILAAGLCVYPQETKKTRENTNEKGKARQENVRQSTGKAQQQSNQAVKQTRTQPATQTRTQPAQTRTQPAVQTRTQPAQNRTQPATQTRTQPAQNRTQPATQTRTQPVPQTRIQAPEKSTQSQNGRVNGENRGGNDVSRDNNQRAVARPENRSGSTNRINGTARIERPAQPAAVKFKNQGANRVYTESKGSLTRDDGVVIHHQNEVVFTKSKYNVNYNNSTALRNSNEFRQSYNDYNTWYDYRMVRSFNNNSGYHPLSIDLRRERNVYRRPVQYNIIWTPFLFNRFMYYYPDETDWDIEFGNEIETISSYDVMHYVGTVKRVYGRVDEVYYSREDNNYILYMGDRFPYQDLSVVIPRSVVFRITGSPEPYFENQYVWLIGLIDMWEEKPEIIIRDEEQIQRY